MPDFKPRLDRDKLNNADTYQVSYAAYSIVHALDNFKDEEKLLGTAAAFLCVCEFMGHPAQDVFTAIKNLINQNSEYKHPQFMAISDYLEGEVNL